MPGREVTRANYFARADVRDPQQRQTYLARCAELEIRHDLPALEIELRQVISTKCRDDVPPEMEHFFEHFFGGPGDGFPMPSTPGWNR